MLIIWKFPKRIAGRTKCPRGHIQAACLRPLVYMVVKLHAHWNKHLLNVKFSYREHCWWLISQTCVNTLIMKQALNLKQQLSINLRYCYSFNRATRNMSATRKFAHHWFEPTSLTTISSHCVAALPAKTSAFHSYMRQNAYHRNLKCIFEDLLPCYCYTTKVNSRTIRSRVSQPASAGKERAWVNCKPGVDPVSKVRGQWRS